MKKLIILITIMIAVLTGCKVDNSVDGRIKSALIEYYEPDRVPVIANKPFPVVHESYKYQSHRILKKVHYGKDATEYTIEHKYKVNIVGHDKHNRKHTNVVECADTIKVTLYNHIYYSKVNDGKVWKY